MKRFLTFLCAAVMLLSLCGCGGTHRAQGKMLHLFYPAEDNGARGGDIIDSVSVNWEQEKDEKVEQQVRDAVELLMKGGTNGEVTSPIPKDTTLQSCSVSNGLARLDFSENYGQLSGMELSVADYCITLTLSQIKGIHMVSITVDGQELAYRHKNVFVPDDVLLTSDEDVVRTLTVQLYFPDQSGKLTAEKRVLTLYEGENQADVLLRALLSGPESEELSPLLPYGFVCQSVRQEEGLSYINLPEDESLMPKKKAEQERLVQGIVESLSSLDGVEQVQFLRGGELQPEYGRVDISRPFDTK